MQSQQSKEHWKGRDLTGSCDGWFPRKWENHNYNQYEKIPGRKGKKVAIIVNERDEVGIDGDAIKRFGFDTKEITSGCICCFLKVGLWTTVTLLAKEYKHDTLMIESASIAFPRVIRDEIKLMNLGEQIKITPLITLIDGSKFKNLMKYVKRFAMSRL